MATMELQTDSVPISLRRNFSWTMLGNVFYAACQWGILAILARLGSPNMVGQLALALAVSAPVMLFANLKLRTVQATDAGNEFAFGSYLGLRLMTTPAALLGIVAFALARYEPTVGIVIIIVGVAKAVESISDIFFGLMQKHERMSTIALSQILKGALSFTCFTVTMILTDSVAWSVASIAASWSVILLLFDIPNAMATLSQPPASTRVHARSTWSLVRPAWSREVSSNLFRRAVPLGLAVALGSISTSIPQYFVEHFRGIHDLGLYASMSYPMIAGSVVINALSQSATPRLARHYAARDVVAFRRLLMRLLALGLLLGAVGIGIVALFGGKLLSAVYGMQYAQQANVFLVIMIGVALGYLYVFLGTAVSAMRKFGIQLPVHMVGAALLTACCLLLIPSFGLFGAAWSLVISQLVLALMYVRVVWRMIARQDFG